MIYQWWDAQINNASNTITTTMKYNYCYFLFTWSKSTTLIRLTPPRESMLAAWLPTPPSPTTTTNVFSWVEKKIEYGSLLTTTLTNTEKNKVSILFRITRIFRNSSLPKNDKCRENNSSSRKDGSGSKEPRSFFIILLLALLLDLNLVTNAKATRLPAPNRNALISNIYQKSFSFVKRMNGKPIAPTRSADQAWGSENTDFRQMRGLIGCVVDVSSPSWWRRPYSLRFCKTDISTSRVISIIIEKGSVRLYVVKVEGVHFASTGNRRLFLCRECGWGSLCAHRKLKYISVRMAMGIICVRPHYVGQGQKAQGKKDTVYVALSFCFRMSPMHGTTRRRRWL